MDQDNYTQAILARAVNQYLQQKIPVSHDGLQLLMNDPDRVVWEIACHIYQESGYQLDFALIRYLIDPRISYLQDFLAKQEAEKLAREKRLAEERRIAEEKRLAEQQRLAEERRVAEEKRLIEQQRLAEERRIAEEKKLAEKKRLEEERRIAEAKLAEERKIAEEKRLAEQQRLVEQKRLQLNRISQELIDSGKDSSIVSTLTQIIEILCDQLKINLESFNLSLYINIDSNNYANLLNTRPLAKIKVSLKLLDLYYDKLDFPCNINTLLDFLNQRIIIWNQYVQELKNFDQSVNQLLPILFKIKFIFAEMLDIEASNIDLDEDIEHYKEDYSSYINYLEIIMKIEEQFNIEIPDAKKIKTIREIFNYVAQKISS